MQTEYNLLDKGYLKYIGHYGSDKEIVQAARISTGGTNKSDEEDRKLINYLMKMRHSSPFEMADITFEVQAPIFVCREWMRHRVFSYNELSGRYSEMPDLFYVPDDSRYGKQGQINKQGTDKLLDPEIRTKLKWDIENEQIDVRTAYEQKLALGLSREISRINLPLSQYSRMCIKGNLLNWFRFIDLRAHQNAQYEIRVYAEKVLDILKELFPWSTYAFINYWFDAKTIYPTEQHVIGCIIQRFKDFNDVRNTIFEDILRMFSESEKKEFIKKFDIK